MRSPHAAHDALKDAYGCVCHSVRSALLSAVILQHHFGELRDQLICR
jgi:hypothetical protein